MAEWLGQGTHVFLIKKPIAQLSSVAAVRAPSRLTGSNLTPCLIGRPTEPGMRAVAQGGGTMPAAVWGLQPLDGVPGSVLSPPRDR